MSLSQSNLLGKTKRLSSSMPNYGLPVAAEFKSGMRYIVVDCGGGTVDLTVHEMEGSGRLKELYKASGGAWGATGVDWEFENLLVKIFGIDFVVSFKKHQACWMGRSHDCV